MVFRLATTFRNVNFGGSWPTSAVGNTSIEINTWTHIAVTFDGGDVNIYVNGEHDEGQVSFEDLSFVQDVPQKLVQQLIILSLMVLMMH